MDWNKMYKKYFYISLTFNLVVLITFLFFTFLYPEFQKENKSSGTHLKDPLSSEQRQAIDSLNLYYSIFEKPLRTRNIEMRLKLWKLLMEEFPDTVMIHNTLAQLKKGENELKDIRYEHFLKEKYILTRIQRTEKLQPAYNRLKKYLENGN
jgi:hypothetical protein